MSKYSLPSNNEGVAGENLGVTSDPAVGPSQLQIQQTADAKWRIWGCECENSVLAPSVESPDADPADEEGWLRDVRGETHV